MGILLNMKIHFLLQVLISTLLAQSLPNSTGVKFFYMDIEAPTLDQE